MQGIQDPLQTVLVQQEYLKNDVDRIKSGEGSSNNEHVDDLNKLKLASIYFYDSALVWHQQFEKLNGDLVSWDDYKKALLARFDTNFKDPLSELKNLNLFLEGMPQAISLHVRMFKPKSLYDIASLCGSFRNMEGYVNPRNQTNALIVPISKVNAINPVRNYLSQKDFDDKMAKMCLMKGNEEEIILPELQHEGRHVALRETTKYPIQWFSRKQLTKHVTQKATNLSSMRLCVPTTFVMSLNVTHKLVFGITQNQALNESLKEFEDVFVLPTALPPQRHHDNRILLKEGATYVNIRPYKHPPSQKDAIMSMKKDGTWRMCIDYRHFQIKTNHFSLKYFLDQRITTPFQSKWLPKLRGFDYEILYKRGKENQAVDALSRSVHGAGQLRRKRKLMVGNNDTVRCKLVNHFHNFAEGGHSGVLAITKRFANWFYWNGMQKAIKNVVNECEIFHRNKADLTAYPGLLQLIPIPQKVWEDILMDFIDGLPMSGGKSVILVVVDRLSKYAHFIPISHPYTAIQVAQLFLDNVYKLHGLPRTIVSDRDKRAHNKMQLMADKHRSEREFVKGDWVYLKLQPNQQITVRQSVQHKLSTKYYRPFQILKKVGQVAYKLELPSNAQFHSVFHVSQLKKCKTAEATMGGFPHCRDDGLIAVTPIAVLDRRMVKKKNRVIVQLLIQWASSSKDATWEPYEEIQKRYPEFAIDS
uniref:Transposon Ty3 Gag-Pol polyprotein n=1 Tax=Tanacetum cinerariifolium TaxID=118510 RepID=A0A6L2NBC8_TANCI|nr:transposon Ty3 Gag-Pol polyprotein [Tanacetum cinerariifolium]